MKVDAIKTGFHLMQQTRLWIWSAVLLSFFVCGLVAWMHFQERKILIQALSGLESIRQARIDLAKGFLHVSMGDEPNLPFGMREGTALLQQAVSSFNDALSQQGLVDENLEKEFRKNVTSFQNSLASWKKKNPKAADMVALRVTFAQLERQADLVDSQIALRLNRLAEHLDNQFKIVFGGAVLFLTLICGVVFYAGKSRNQLAEAFKASETLLRENWQFLGELVEHSGTAIFIKDTEGYYQMVNKKWEESTGLKREDIIGKKDVEVFPTSVGQAYRANDDEVIKTGAVLEREEVLDGPYGRRYFISIKFPLHAENGKIRSVCGVATEITERKQVEAALRLSEARLRSVVEVAPDAIFIQTGGCFRFVNPMALKLFGVAQENEIIGHLVVHFFHPDFREKIKERIKRLNEGREVVPLMEERILRPNGTEVEVEVSAVPFKYDEEDGALVFVRDLSDRREAEKKIRKLSTAVEQSPVSVTITDESGTIEYVNPKFCRSTGYSPEEAIGKSLNTFAGENLSIEEFERLWKTGALGREWHGECKSKRKNGETFWEFASISPIVDSGGQIIHYLAVKEDITERKKLEEQLRQSQKLESIGQLAGGVAHDFNNILAVIMMRLGLFQNEEKLDPEVKAQTEELMADARRAASLTRQLLMFSRRSVLDVRVLDLNELVANLLKMLKRLIGEHIGLSFDRMPDLPLVQADPSMMEQVVMNLVVNARDAMMPKGGQLFIQTRSVVFDEEQIAGYPQARAGRFVCLSVSDTGCGMDENTLKKIFDPFFTTKEAGKGTGLGLATVHGIVAQHSGWVDVVSKLGQGTTFRVYLPECSEPMSITESDDFSNSTSGNETILFVEDDARLRNVVSQTLQRRGYTVLETRDGKEALEVWRHHREDVDLLLTDMMMPEEITGLDLSRQLRQDRPDLSVIISSGYSTEAVGNLKYGVNDGIMRLAKPYQAEILMKAIRDCLDLH